jgi:hypothetical protein
VPAARIGTVGQRSGMVALHLRDARIEHSVQALREVYFGSIPRRMGD